MTRDGTECSHEIDILTQNGVELPADEQIIQSFICRVLAEPVFEARGWELSVTFCGSEHMAQLNRDYRGKDGTTDVLTFCLNEHAQTPNEWCAPGELQLQQVGDIVVDPAQVESNARDFDVSTEEELRRVLVHGLLHLSGMDHSTNDATEPMLALQEEILARLSDQRLF